MFEQCKDFSSLTLVAANEKRVSVPGNAPVAPRKSNGRLKDGESSAMSQSNNSEGESESGDNDPLIQKIDGAAAGKSVKQQESDSDSEDEPLAQRESLAKASGKEKKQKVKRSADLKASTSKRVKKEKRDSDEDVKPFKNKKDKESIDKSSKSKGKKAIKKDDSVEPGLGTSKKGKNGKGKVKEEEDGSQPAESDDEDFKWWEEQNADGEEGPKWSTLEHNGVLFPPEYTPLPSTVKLKFDGNLA